MSLLQRPAIKVFVGAILLMGVIRFALTVAGFPDSTVTYFSMSAIIMTAMVYFGIATETHTERLKAAWIVVFPYMLIEVAALIHTWVTGQRTIFHTEETSLGFPIAMHTIGHLVGGLTWEPVAVFIGMELVWGIGALMRSIRDR